MFSVKRSQFILFGDSITQWSFSVGGWGALLADRYQRRVDVLNRGYSGYNTRWALETLSYVFDENNTSSVQLVSVFFGANDAALETGESSRQFISLDEFTSNMKKILQHIKSVCSNDVEIVLISPPPICHEQRLEAQRKKATQCGFTASGKLERTNENTGKYANAVEELAKTEGLRYINLWRQMQDDRDDWSIFLDDGLHLSAAGNARVFELLVNALPTHLQVTPCPITNGYGLSGSSSSSSIQHEFPWHDQIDHCDHQKAFKG